MQTAAIKRQARFRRHVRIRKRVRGTAARPRLAVFRSNRHIYAQIIDDERGHTIASASSLGLPADAPEGAGSIATQVGARVAQQALAAGVDTVVFDRGGYLYHGQVQALADAARAGGLTF